jgi:hypothetical protein
VDRIDGDLELLSILTASFNRDAEQSTVPNAGVRQPKFVRRKIGTHAENCWERSNQFPLAAQLEQCEIATTARTPRRCSIFSRGLRQMGDELQNLLRMC